MYNDRVRPEVTVHPIDFPIPEVKQATLRKVFLVLGTDKIVSRSALETSNGNVYEIGRVLKDAIYGHVYHAILLYHQPNAANVDSMNGSNGSDSYYCRANPLQQVAIKAYSKERIREYRGRTQENPIKELSSMQYLGDHPNIMCQIECVEDRENIYSIMPFCDGGELYDIIESKGAMTEPVARYYFIQILQAVLYLQYKGVAHRDMSLENIMFDSVGKCFIIDFGMCLRIPLPTVTAVQPTNDPHNRELNELNRVFYQQCQVLMNYHRASTGPSQVPIGVDGIPPPPPPPEESEDGMTIDTHVGTTMTGTINNAQHSSTHLDSQASASQSPIPLVDFNSLLMNISAIITIKIPHQGVCGKRNYISPEVIENTPYFEPFNVDIWALGVILFIMLTGVPPVDTASSLDQRYRLICAGFLSNMLDQWNIHLSYHAIDLLKKILRPVPTDRLTIHEIMKHPWVLNQM